jgi:probable rRNA maturation factor
VRSAVPTRREMEPESRCPAQAGIQLISDCQFALQQEHGLRDRTQDFGPDRGQVGLPAWPEARRRFEGDIIVAEPGWRRLVPHVEAVVARAAGAAGAAGTIVLAADRVVRRLNARHRGRDKATNVLTYEQPAPEIILALGVVAREAAAATRRPAHHLAHLVVHGALHLQGHDHDQPGAARRMEMAEARILRRIGVPNPWKHA